MMKTLVLILSLALSHCHLHGQEAAEPLSFEVASIAPCPPGTRPPMSEHAGLSNVTSPGGRFQARASLRSLIEWAYGIQPAQHAGGPAWMNSDLYEVAAKAETNVTEAQMRLMMRTLLAERFGLKTHYETRQIPAFVISTGKAAPKLTPAKEGEAHDIRMTQRTEGESKVAAYRVTATRFTLGQFTDIFSRQLDLAVLDRTGLEGEYNFTLDLAPSEANPNPLDPSLLMTAMREQLGLTLKSEKVSAEVLVIDSAEKVAAGN